VLPVSQAPNAAPLLVYFHGVPGAPVEALWLEAAASLHGQQVCAPDRFALDASLRGDEYFRTLAHQIIAEANGRRVHFVGFSMGAFVALQTSRFLQEQVCGIHLVSAAAPLDGGDFLDALAGKQVFRLAQKSPLLFGLLTRWQGLLAAYFPGALFRMLFASARGGDVALALDADFQSVVQTAMQNAFGAGQAGYRREVLAYVRPWAESLAEIRAPVHLWHGDMDNWSVPEMSRYLHTAVPNAASFHVMAGLSHYSCLKAAIPEICLQVAAQLDG
jgi:pimeloyl-ACP methyl ester carboxylesterase